MKDRTRPPSTSRLSLIKGFRRKASPPPTPARFSPSHEDYESLVRISTAQIACFEFAKPVDCRLNSEEFVNALYSTHSSCHEASLACAVARGRDSVDELLGGSLEDLFPRNEGFDEMFARWYAQSLTAQCFEFESESPTSQGTILQCVLYGRIEFEQLSRFWIVLRDVTSHSRAVHALARTELHYRSLIERPGILYARVAADGCYEYITPRLVNTLGVSIEEVSARRVKLCDYVHPDDTEAVDRLLSRRRGDFPPEAYDTELRIKVVDGTYHWFSVRQLPVLSTKGALAFIDLIATDITTTKALEEEVVALRPRALAGQLAAGVAHDIRNHLTAALGNLDVVLEQAGEIEASTQRALRAAQEAVISAWELSRDFTTVSRSQSGDESCSTNLATALTSSLAIFRSVLPRSIALSVSEIPNVTIPLSRARLQNTLLNMIINARDALGTAAGEIKLGTAVVTADDKAPSIAITVSDNGSGIPADILPKVFDPYVSTKQASGGSGLGLYTARECIEAAGGRISVSSKVGRGTTFVITLPLCPEACSRAWANTPPSAITEKARKLSILVADDEDGIRSMLETALAHRGHVVDAVADGAALMSKVSQSPTLYDVLLVDESMPRSPGRQLLPQLRKLLPHTPIIVTSGDPTVAHDALRLGPQTQFLAKPFSLSELESALLTVGT